MNHRTSDISHLRYLSISESQYSRYGMGSIYRDDRRREKTTYTAHPSRGRVSVTPTHTRGTLDVKTKASSHACCHATPTSTSNANDAQERGGRPPVKGKRWLASRTMS